MVHASDDLSLDPLIGQVLLIVVFIVFTLSVGILGGNRVVLIILEHLLDELVSALLCSARCQFWLLV